MAVTSLPFLVFLAFLPLGDSHCHPSYRYTRLVYGLAIFIGILISTRIIIQTLSKYFSYFPSLNTYLSISNATDFFAFFLDDDCALK